MIISFLKYNDDNDTPTGGTVVKPEEIAAGITNAANDVTSNVSNAISGFFTALTEQLNASRSNNANSNGSNGGNDSAGASGNGSAGDSAGTATGNAPTEETRPTTKNRRGNGGYLRRKLW